MKVVRLLLIIIALAASQIYSLPRYALRSGAACINCHQNPTGGGLRTVRGFGFSKAKLPIIKPDPEFEVSNKLTENITFGVDYRSQYLTTFRDSLNRSDWQKMTASVYTGIQLSKEINVTSRYDFLWNIWEGYVTAFILPGDGYIKGGTFTPNFGLRMDDHTAYTEGGDMGLVTNGNQRRGLIYDPMYVETGVEIGYSFEDMVFLTASVGNASQLLFRKDPSYTASVSIVPFDNDDVHFFLGSSISIFKDTRLDANFNQIYPEVQMFGGHMGFGFSGFTLLGEFDFAKGYILNDSTSTALMIEAAYQFTDGVELVLRYDRFDPLSKLEKDELSRFIVGFELHPYSFIEIRPQYRMQMEDPKISNDSFVVQFHLYY